MSIQVENLSQLQQKLRRLPDAVTKAAADEIQATGVRIRDNARNRVRDREIRPTIKKRKLSRGLDARVGTKHWRAIFEEFGTKRHVIRPRTKQVLSGGSVMSSRSGGVTFDDEAFGPVTGPITHPGQEARPFMQPAAEEERREFPARLAAAINVAMTKVAQR